MKLYYAMAILEQLLLASLSRNKKEMAYMLFIWKNLFDVEIQAINIHLHSPVIDELKETKLEASNHEYPTLLER